MAVTAQLSWRGSTANGFASAARLKGHSGASLQLIVEDGHDTVRKTAADRAHNDRLLGQAGLQRHLIASGIPMPAVLAEGMTGCGKAYFDMEYVPADNIAQVLPRSDQAFDHRLVTSALERFLRFCVQTKSRELPAALFEAKIAHIANVCLTRSTWSEYWPSIFDVARRLLALSWVGIPASECHGDLTLENVLVSQSTGVVFVDCDVTFASSYWLDAGKLFQDIEGGWCLREYEGTKEWQIATGRLRGLVQPISDAIARVDRELMCRVQQLASLNLFRTLPYVKSGRVAGYVLGRIDNLLTTKVTEP